MAASRHGRRVGRPKRKKLAAAERRKRPDGCKLSEKDKGYVIGAASELLKQGKSKFFADLGRRTGKHRSTISRLMKNPQVSSSQSSADSSSAPLTQQQKRIVDRRKATVEKAIQLTPTMPDGQKKIAYPSAQSIRHALPAKLKASKSTVKRDLRASDFQWFIRPKTPRETPSWKKARESYARAQLRNRASVGLLYPSDESLFYTNDHTQRGQWARSKLSVIPRHTAQYPPQVHVWACIGKGFKTLVVHEDKSKKAKKEPPKRQQKRVVELTKNGVSKTKRYVMKDLQKMNAKQLRDWLSLERARASPDCLSGINSSRTSINA